MQHRSLFATVMLCLFLGLPAGAVTQAQDTPGKAAAQPPASKSANPPLNLNTATLAQLEALPGIGAKVAARITEYREKNGGFKKSEELMNVRGIGEKAFLRIRSLITVTPAKPEPSTSPTADAAGLEA